jgi:hypothetical protein
LFFFRLYFFNSIISANPKTSRTESNLSLLIANYSLLIFYILKEFFL